MCSLGCRASPFIDSQVPVACFFVPEIKQDDSLQIARSHGIVTGGQLVSQDPQVSGYRGPELFSIIATGADFPGNLPVGARVSAKGLQIPRERE